jgi:glycosyltransferase involved in cell wall biosynthesis
MRVAFAIENHLGHRTAAANLRRALADVREVDSVWIPIHASGNGLLDHIPRLRDQHMLMLALSARRGLRRAAQDGPLDAVLLHTQRAAHLNVDWMRRTPTFLSIDSTPATLEQYRALEGRASQVGTRYWALRDAIHRRTYRAARGIVCMSEIVRAAIVEQYRVPLENTLVLLPGVDLDYWSPPSQDHAEQPVRILFVGGDFARKGGPLLARWAAKPGKVDYVLDLVTEHPVEVPSHVRVHTGLKPNDAMLRELVRRADLFVLPSLADLSPWSVAEAKATGTAVIASAVGALPEMVRDGIDGWLVQPGDFPDLSRRLDAAITSRQRLLELGARAREDAELRFCARRNASQLLDFMMVHR